ncbi:hypothetical protein GKE82_05850 [Conexibacter sp. W3-3-2]|uniref:hypothetical protein n=1 Tax=Conexibacter sp. W3-3-2 TaxID=2675227 RepID=UPI0012B6BDE6|nr:hypothetical protein [Conexibacter sp. W3-3-2]MTD43839.1 hypothetical protein [Conexibacter sp. W3-3-2]
MNVLKPERPIWEAGPAGPWAARVKVRPITRGRAVLFEVVASWVGPPQVQFPADPLPGERNDAYATPDRALALEVAARALESLREGERGADVGPGERAAVDLRAIARDLIRRDDSSPYADPGLGAAAPAA